VSVRPEPDAARHAGHGVTLAAGALLNVLAFLTSNLRGIFTFLVARLLGGPILGTFGVAWAVVDLASKFGTLGLDLNVIPFVARSEAAADRKGTRAIFSTALSVAICASLVVAALGSLTAHTLGPFFGMRAKLVTATTVMFLAVPGIVLYRVSNGLSRGLKVMGHDVYSRGLTESLVTASALLVAVALGARLLAPVYAAIAGTLASGLVAFGLAARAFGGPRPEQASRQSAVRDLVRTSLPIAAYDLLNIGIMRIDVIMLGLYAGRAPGVTLETLGIYAACVETAGGLRKVSQAFTPILTPVLAEQIAANRVRDAEASYAYVARWMLAVGMLFAGGASIVGFIVFALGTGFSNPKPVLSYITLTALPFFAIAAPTKVLSGYVSRASNGAFHAGPMVLGGAAASLVGLVVSLNFNAVFTAFVLAGVVGPIIGATLGTLVKLAVSPFAAGAISAVLGVMFTFTASGGLR